MPIPPLSLCISFWQGRKQFPYLTQERFPNDWAQIEIIKQFLKNRCRHDCCMGRLARPNMKNNKVDKPEGTKCRANEPTMPAVPTKHYRYADDTDTNGAGPSRLRSGRHPQAEGEGESSDMEDLQPIKGDEASSDDEDDEN